MSTTAGPDAPHPGWTKAKRKRRAANGLTQLNATVLHAVCTGGYEGAQAALGMGRSAVRNHLHDVYLAFGLRGGGAMGQACYRLGRHERRQAEGS